MISNSSLDLRTVLGKEIKSQILSLGDDGLKYLYENVKW